MTEKLLTTKKKALILSDTHGRSRLLAAVLERHRDADYLFHLGDGLADLVYLGAPEQALTVVAVPGNCDPPDTAMAFERMIEIAGCRILLTHGHTLGVKGGLARAAAFARARQADLLLFGHTHLPHNEYRPAAEGEAPLYLFNPGSLGHPVGGRPTYGVLEIRENGLLLTHARL